MNARCERSPASEAASQLQLSTAVQARTKLQSQ